MREFDQPEWEPAENVDELEDVTRFHEQYPHAPPGGDAPALEGFVRKIWNCELEKGVAQVRVRMLRELCLYACELRETSMSVSTHV